jgi:hypothetical protein
MSELMHFAHAAERDGNGRPGTFGFCNATRSDHVTRSVYQVTCGDCLRKLASDASTVVQLLERRSPSTPQPAPVPRHRIILLCGGITHPQGPADGCQITIGLPANTRGDDAGAFAKHGWLQLSGPSREEGCVDNLPLCPQCADRYIPRKLLKAARQKLGIPEPSRLVVVQTSTPKGGA